MKVIEFIKEHGINILINKYGIIVSDYPDRMVLNYSQTNSPKTADVVKECRGLILSKPDLKVLCRPFDRFYNYGEANTKDFDFSKAICYEKLDGSLCNLYYDGDKWCFATRGMAFAEGETQFGGGKKFIDIINSVVEERSVMYERLPRGFTYIFELTSPYNRVVTRYKEPMLTLLSIRDSTSGHELSMDEVTYVASILNVNRPKEYRFLNFNMAMESARELPKLEEGYVCFIQDTGERVKVKNPSYLAIAHLRENGIISEKRIIQLICEEGDDEYLTYFPEDHTIFAPYRRKYLSMLEQTLELYRSTSEISYGKDFALAVKDSPAAKIMFMMKKGKTFRESLNSLTINSKISLINSY